MRNVATGATAANPSLCAAVNVRAHHPSTNGQCLRQAERHGEQGHLQFSAPQSAKPAPVVAEDRAPNSTTSHSTLPQRSPFYSDEQFACASRRYSSTRHVAKSKKVSAQYQARSLIGYAMRTHVLRGHKPCLLVGCKLENFEK